MKARAAGNPLWTRDRERILYTSSRENMLFGDLYWKASDESGGKPEVYVRPFPEVNKGRFQVSTRGSL